MTYYDQIESPVGLLTVVSDGTSVTRLWIEGQKYSETEMREISKNPDLAVFKQVKEWMDCYFSGKDPGFLPPMAPAGGEFRQSVWNILREIPYGHLITYGDIARQIAEQRRTGRMSAQAVGGAVGHNPISILIPCHRVVGTHGNLTGYSGGLPIKVKLLELEHVSMDQLSVNSFFLDQFSKILL